jgi:probable DNA metabolism protein
MISYIFDGSFAGLLCCVFRAYEFKDRQQAKNQPIRVYAEQHFQPELFAQSGLLDDQSWLAEEISIVTDEAKAQRVWTALCQKTGSSFKRHFYFSYLSEQAAAFQHLFEVACYVFDHADAVHDNYGHPAVLAVAQMAKSVSREKHRMEAFVRFKKTVEGIYFAVISPDFNVLPLITAHFKNRYADQHWLIYDEKRRYGIFYDLSGVHEVQLSSFSNLRGNSGTTFSNASLIEQSQLTDASITLDAQEALYDQLWKDYFKSTNIVERRNLKLHMQHVPKRYWKYLSEKNP